MIDQGDKTRRRLFNSLGVRLSLALGLLALIVYGVATGQLGHRNPWDPGPRAQSSDQVQEQLEEAAPPVPE